MGTHPKIWSHNANGHKNDSSKDSDESQVVHIFPERAFYYVWMCFPLDQHQYVNSSIIDSASKIITSSSHLLHSGNNCLRFDVRQLQPGDYFIRLVSRTNVFVAKFKKTVLET